jgi:hypothetical protein
MDLAAGEDRGDPLGAGDVSAARFKFGPASDVRTERIQWLIRGLVPLRGVTVVGGEKALGKSLLTGAVWAADVTRGNTDGEHRGDPRGVLLCSAEDDWPTVIVPRLLAAGADLNLVYQPIAESGDSLIEFPRDVEALRAQVAAHADAGRPLALVVIDPIGAFLGSDIDSHRDASVRRALAPLAEMAMSTNVAIVVVAHLNKAEGSRLVNRVVGSVGFVNAARSFVAYGRDPEDPEGERGTRRVIVPTASNWGPLATSLAANVESREVDLYDNSHVSVGYLNITGSSEVSVEDLQRGADDGADSDDIEQAILDALADGKPHKPRETKSAVVAELGCSPRTVQRWATSLEDQGLIARDASPQRGAQSSWQRLDSLDTSPSPNVSKTEMSPKTLRFPHLGHTETQAPVQAHDDRPQEQQP